MISGCKDSQTSADVGAGSMGVQKAAGAMTTAFRHTINQSVNCHDLLINMRAYLKRNGFDQVPQMSSDKFVQLDSSFVHYQEKKTGKRPLPPSQASPMAMPTPGGHPMAMPTPQGGMPTPPGMAPHGYGSYPMTPGPPPGHPLSPGGNRMTPPGHPDDPMLHHRLGRLEQEIANLRAVHSQSPQNGAMSPMMPRHGSPMMQHPQAQSASWGGGAPYSPYHR